MCFTQENASSDEVVEHLEKSLHSYRLSRLKTLNEKLKYSLICKCCNSAQIEMLNLPCAHIVCCEKCADAATVCPLCNDQLLGTVKIFMA